MKIALPKIMVGTLYSGESEIVQCKSMIQNQIGVQVEHIVIPNLPEAKAHRALFDIWNKRRTEFEIFVKCDADTVLKDERSLLSIVEYKLKNNFDGLQLRLLDYFSKQYIYGLGVFSNRVVFDKPRKKLYPDRVVDRDKYSILSGNEFSFLEPIGYHCLNPHPVQSFRFGLHRELKNQESIIADTARNWLIEKDEARMWALIGAFHAKDHWRNSINYSDKKFKRIFDSYLISNKSITNLVTRVSETWPGKNSKEI